MLPLELRDYPLTFRQMDFVKHYLATGSASRAAKLAGYKNPDQKGTVLLRNFKVADCVRDMLERRWDPMKMGAAEALGRLAMLARVDPRAFYKEDGSVKGPHELDEATAFALRGIETELSFDAEGKALPSVTKKIKIADPLPALRTIAQIQQLLQPASVTNINVIYENLDVQLDQARKRVLAAERDDVVSDQ